MNENNYEESRPPYPAQEEPEMPTGEAEEVDEEVDEVVTSWFDERADARADVDTAIAAWNFLEEIDMQHPDILTWNLKRRIRQTKKNCLLILIKSIDELTLEKEESDED